VHPIDLIVTLTGGLAAALAAGYLTHRLGLSPIVGYLFAGLLVGPYTPGFVADRHLAEQLAEVGVILLMFGVGLQFHIEELLAVRKIAIPGALVQSGLATVLGAWVGHSAGWSWEASVVFGIALSVASTVVLVRVLTDNRDLHTPTGHIAIGWLVVEDILTVLVLVLMPAVFSPGSNDGPIWITVVLALVKIGVLVVFTIAAGGRAIPWLLTHVASTRSRELFTLTVLVVALGIAVASAKLFGVSMALGAFLAGMVVGRSDFSVRAASEAMPMRDAFAVLFFVSVGMLVDPAQLAQQPMLVLLTLAVILLGKPLAALAIAWLFRYPLKVGLSVAVALAQIGEFSFIVATLGNGLGVLAAEATQVLVAAAIISITLNPLLYRSVDGVSSWVAKRRGVTATEGRTDGRDDHESKYRAIVVGHGPIGRIVTRLLHENEIEPTVIELNMDTVKRLREEGVRGIYGDASQLNTLTSAGVAGARGIIVSVAGMPGIEETIRVARELNPAIQILVRTSNLREAAALRSAGANVVFSGEGEVALAFTEAILENLGATPEQVERERARVHAELA
jgi:K+:H+ antiporter